jgi:hypothetical protein
MRFLGLMANYELHVSKKATYVTTLLVSHVILFEQT